MAGSHWADTESCQRRTSVTRRLHHHPQPHAPLPPPRTGRHPRRGGAGTGGARDRSPPPAALGSPGPRRRNWGKSVISHPRAGGRRGGCGCRRCLCHPRPQPPRTSITHPRRLIEPPANWGSKTMRYLSMSEILTAVSHPSAFSVPRKESRKWQKWKVLTA
ncbi:unnamed protein product, partial [Bubo scandiacus]